MTSHVVGVAVIIWSLNSLGNWRIPSCAAICTLLPFVPPPPPPNSPLNDLAEYSLLAASRWIRSLEVPHTLISKVIIIIFQPSAIARILASLCLSFSPSYHPQTRTAYVTAPTPAPTSLLYLLRDHVSRFFPSSLVDFNLLVVGTGDLLSRNRDLDLDMPRDFHAQDWVEGRTEAVHRMSRL